MGHCGPFLRKTFPKWVKTSKLAENNVKFEIYDLKNFKEENLT